MLSKLIATSFAGYAYAAEADIQTVDTDVYINEDENKLDIFANLILNEMNEPFYPPAVNYYEELQKLDTKRENGELAGSDAFKTMCEIAQENGFICDSNTVITEDGYILNVWRVRNKDL